MTESQIIDLVEEFKRFKKDATFRTEVRYARSPLTGAVTMLREFKKRKVPISVVEKQLRDLLEPEERYDVGCLLGLLRRVLPEYYYGDVVPQEHETEYLLGDAYKWGNGVRTDYTEAVKWYRKSAEQGNGGAQFSLGLMYDEGKGVPQDHKEAAKWFKLASQNPVAFNFSQLVDQGLTPGEAHAKSSL